MWGVVNEVTQAAPNNRKIRIVVGDTREVEIPWIRDVQVSRRGIIFLRHISGKAWEVVGLRSGLVMVAGDAPSETSPLLIEVLPQTKAHRGRHDKLTAPVAETVDSTAAASGNAVVEPKDIILRAFVTLEEEAAGDRLGFSTQPTIFLHEGKKRPMLEWHPEFSSLATERKVKTIASPVFTVTTGSTASAQSGGEFRVQFDTDKGGDTRREGWKEHGFRLSLSPDSLGHDDITLTYTMTLKTISSAGGDTSALSANELNGTLRMQPGKLVVAGSINLSGKGRDTQGAFSTIPILGPLLKEHSSDHIQKKLVLWLIYDPIKDLIPDFGHPNGHEPAKIP